MDVTCRVTFATPDRTFTLDDVRDLTRLIDSESEALMWQCETLVVGEALRTHPFHDAATISTRVQSDDDRYTWRDLCRCIIFAAAGSRARPDWTVQVDDDNARIATRFGHALSFRGGQPLDPTGHPNPLLARSVDEVLAVTAGPLWRIMRTRGGPLGAAAAAASGRPVGPTAHDRGQEQEQEQEPERDRFRPADAHRRLARDEAIALVRAAVPHDEGDALVAAMRPAITLAVTSFVRTPLPIGASRALGQPDVPPDFVWPRDARGRPLVCLAQIRMADCAALDSEGLLPAFGWLIFFLRSAGPALSDGSGACVVHVDSDVASLVRMRAPARARPAWADGLEARPVAFGRSFDLPRMDDPSEAHDVLAVALGGRATRSDATRYHHLLGYAQAIQGEMAEACARKRGGTAADWRILLQLDSQDLVWSWMDGGRLFLWILESDLRARRFDTLCAFIQSG